MQIKVACEHDIFILSLEGRLDHKGAADLEDAIKALPGEPSHLILAMLEWILPMVSYQDITVIRKQASAYWAAILAERIMDLEKQTD